MAIIVDKEAKRKAIALSCKTLFVEKGINRLTISEIAKTAGVGKGTIYEYFANKEEIVFEVVNILMYEYNIKKEQKINATHDIKEKIRLFFSFYYDEDVDTLELRILYKEFISISLATQNSQMLTFNTECFESYYQWFCSIIDEGIQNGTLIQEASGLSRGLFSMAKGFFISTEITDNSCSIEKELEIFFTTLYKLIEVKK